MPRSGSYMECGNLLPLSKLVNCRSAHGTPNIPYYPSFDAAIGILRKVCLSYSTGIIGTSDTIVTYSTRLLGGSKSWGILQSVTGVLVMLSNRISLGLAAFLLVVTAAMTAHGQDHELEGAALFEPADIRPYDNWAEPKQGLFFTFDGLYWHISPPAKTTVGDPTYNPTVYFLQNNVLNSFLEQNSVDTSGPSVWKWGDRMELGYIDGHQGFMFTSLETQSQTMETSAANAT